MERTEAQETQSASPNKVAWYPGPPSEEIPVSNLQKTQTHTEEEDKSSFDPFAELNVKYLPSNRWNSVPKEKAEKARRHRPKGVEMRRLPSNHFLHGQFGLFATERFSRFDVLGEYTGKVVGDDVNGHYVAALEDKGLDDSLGLDAEHQGNEMRFINSYLNIGFRPNVSMRTVYINSYPHIVIVCTEDIDVGEEILLDYGEAYTKAYLTPKPHLVRTGEISLETFKSSLPFCSTPSDSEDDEKN